MSRKSSRSNTPLARLIRRLQWAYAESDRTGIPTDELLAMRRELEQKHAQQLQERRHFIKTVGGAIAGLGMLNTFGPAFAATSTASKDPGRVIIIGAGLAGLRCAHRLRQYGYACKLYEANTRIGGRAYTERGFFDNAMSVERGGELISTEHSALRNLVNQLGLKLEDVNGGSLPGGQELYSVNNSLYREDQLAADWRGIYDLFKRSEQAAPWQPVYNNFNAEHRRLDHLNANDWMNQVGIGANSNFGQVMQANLLSEYGLNPDEQTCLNLIYLMSGNPINKPLPMAGTDEKWHIVGGNDALISALLKQLPADALSTGKALSSIGGSPNGPYVCGFSDGSSEICDQLVLALPFTKLREVSISAEILATISPAKRLAIKEMRMGANGKIHTQHGSRPWANSRYIDGQLVQMNGTSYSGGNGFVVTWDTQVTNPSAGSVLCDYLGGTQGRGLNTSTPFASASKSDVTTFLEQIEPVFPGTRAAYQGKALVSKWSINPWSLGSYSAPALGHYTSFWGSQWEKDAGNRIHFCGEHTSPEYWGFFNGAVETGERAAQALVQG